MAVKHIIVDEVKARHEFAYIYQMLPLCVWLIVCGSASIEPVTQCGALAGIGYMDKDIAHGRTIDSCRIHYLYIEHVCSCLQLACIYL